ncbi:MAG: ComF family protein [Ruminococcaceae bacterium]|nr:ComF family protein [Oscillospiraceae bacterium]
MKITDQILRWLFPPKCVLCGKVLNEEETDFCHACRIESPECPVSNRRKLPFLDSWLAVWYYEDSVRDSILRFKFRRARGYAGTYGRALAMKIQQEHPEGFDCLTWVPISPLRKFTRGYDQVELLAQSVGRELGVEPVALLQKVRHNRPQSGIVGDAQRRANVLGAYRAVNTDVLQDKKVLILDDIITTGATLGECARVLLTAGAGEIHCGAVAIARRQKQSR